MEMIPKPELERFYQNALKTIEHCQDLPSYKDGIETGLRALAERFDLRTETQENEKGEAS